MNVNFRVYFPLFYGPGWLIDWAYWIANPWVADGEPELVGAIMVGWIPALLWPLHLFVKIWEWILL